MKMQANYNKLPILGRFPGNSWFGSFFYHLSKKTFQLNKEIFGFFQTLLLCFHSSKMIILTTTTIYKEFLPKVKVEIKPNN